MRTSNIFSDLYLLSGRVQQSLGMNSHVKRPKETNLELQVLWNILKETNTELACLTRELKPALFDKTFLQV
jgi:hypothetical protein